ncbi:MAG: hypothetical protein HXY53_08985 [Nitrospirae bacterium]|nr:hypothetical protein [Nitrospirota bacterium]
MIENKSLNISEHTSLEFWKENFFELYALLRALDRFFSIENHPISQDDLSNRNFYEELTAARNIILRILNIIETVIPEAKRNSYWFLKFAESKFLTDYSRDVLKEELYKQDTFEKGLYLLYDSLINIKGIITDILRSDKVSYISFKNIGELIGRQIRGSLFFNPFRKKIYKDFDRIENKKISKIVKSIQNSETKKYISMVYLSLFRFLKYLSLIDTKSQHSISMDYSSVLLIMLRSELNTFHKFLNNILNFIKDKKLQSILQSISYQFSMETKRVYLQELKEIFRKKAPQQFIGRIENSHGILKNLIEQCIVQISQALDSSIQGQEIFESFSTKLAQSLKLREDIYVLRSLLSRLESTQSLSGDFPLILESTKDFMHYFESFTFKLLRYDDYDEFANFFHDFFLSTNLSDNKMLEKIHNFKIFLEATLQHISKRAELIDKPLDIQRAEELLNKYLHK